MAPRQEKNMSRIARVAEEVQPVLAQHKKVGVRPTGVSSLESSVETATAALAQKLISASVRSALDARQRWSSSPSVVGVNSLCHGLCDMRCEGCTTVNLAQSFVVSLASNIIISAQRGLGLLGFAKYDSQRPVFFPTKVAGRIRAKCVACFLCGRTRIAE